MNQVQSIIKILLVRLTCVNFFLLYSVILGFGQSNDFNKRYTIQNNATLFWNINAEKDSLIITGEIGSDSSGLQGVFIVWSDTLGNLGRVKIFRDPKQIDQMILAGSNPIINDTNKLVLAGDFLWKSDNYIIKYNKNTGENSYKEYSASFIVRFTESLLELNGEYYIIGFVQTQNFDLDAFVQKIDPSGNLIWEKKYGVPSKDEVGRAAIIKDGKLIIMISESFDNTPSTKNDSRYWIRFLEIDTSGSIKNDWKEEVTGKEGWSGSLVNFNGDYIYTTNLLGEEIGIGYLQAGQVVRRDENFKLVWRKPYGDPDNYYNGLGDLIIAPDGNLLVTGQVLDESQNFVLQRVFKICPNGEILWEVQDTGIIVSGQSLNNMEGIVSNSCNSVYSVGYTYKSSGVYEGLILKISGDGCIDTLCTTVDIENLLSEQHQKMTIYPNPASSTIQIKFSDRFPYGVIRLYDVLGELKQTVSISSTEKVLDVSSLSNGIYWLVAESNGTLIGSQKFLKVDP